MNILLENKHYYPSIGGVEVGIKQLSDRFVKAGHKVTVITFRTAVVMRSSTGSGWSVFPMKRGSREV